MTTKAQKAANICQF